MRPAGDQRVKNAAIAGRQVTSLPPVAWAACLAWLVSSVCEFPPGGNRPRVEVL